MPWLESGDAVCDTCGKARIGHLDRHQAIQMLRAGNWHHAKGLTIGGVPYEAILCPGCARDEHKRTRKIITIEQDALFAREGYEKVEQGQGIQSR